MVIIVYLEHSAVKHQTTSGMSVLEKKKSPEKTMQKKKLTNLPGGCSFVDHLIRGKTTNKAKNIDLCEQQINNTTQKHAKATKHIDHQTISQMTKKKQQGACMKLKLVWP